MKDYLQNILDEIKEKRITKSEGIDLIRNYKSGEKTNVQSVAEINKSAETNVSSEQLTMAGRWHIVDQTDDTAHSLISKNTVVICSPDTQYNGFRSKFKQFIYLSISNNDTISSIQQNLKQVTSIDHIIWLGAAEPLSKATEESIITGQEKGVILIFKLIKALLELSYGGKLLKWTFITTKALVVNLADTVNPTHASVHGFTGVMSKEYPNWAVQLLDLEKEKDLESIDIFSLPLDRSGHALAYRHQRWYKQEYYPCIYQNKINDLYKNQGIYIVIGGAGGIGEVWTKHMIENYSAQVIWVGRRDVNHEIQAKISALEKLGPKPLYYKADATNLSQLQSVVNDVKCQFGIINGVVNSALVVSDRSLAELNEEDLRKGLASKVDVCVRLAQVFVDEPLDFMLFFSSMASLTRERGHSVYSAACVFKDAFAQHLVANCQYPVKVMNWGYWSSVGAGMLVPDSFKIRLNKSGIGSIEPSEGMIALDAFLASSLTQVAFTKSVRPQNLEGYQDRYNLIEYPNQISSFISELPKVLPMAESLKKRIDVEVEDPMNQMLPILCKLLFSQLHKIGFFSSRYMDVEKEKRRVGMLKVYDRWLNESLSILTKGSFLTPDTNGFIVENLGSIDVNAIWQEWEEKKPNWLSNNQINAKVRILEISLKALADVLLGKKLATEVIFPNSSMKLVEGIYKFNVVADYFNEVLANIVLEYLKKRVEKGNIEAIRILEIGAGTGGTSDMVFKKLRPYQQYVEEYCYTDLSKAFLIHAEKEFGSNNPYLTYKIFDVSKPLENQQIDYDYFDLVIATNVLHATKNIRHTLQNTKATLKKNGLLLLNELSSNNMVNHLAFSLLEGWWLSEDGELRIPGCPGLYPEMWEQVLKNEGFKTIFFPALDAHHLGQQIIVSESDGCTLRKAKNQSQIPSKDGTKPYLKTERSENHSLLQNDELIEQVRRTIVVKLSESLKIEADQIGVDEPFADYGLDSITGVHMMELLNDELQLTLPTTDLFDYSSVNKLATHIVEEHSIVLENVFVKSVHSLPEETLPDYVSSEISVSARPIAQKIKMEATTIDKLNSGREPIAIVGMSGRFPQSENVDELWDHLKQGHELIEEISRWTISVDFKEKQYCTRGGFLKDIDRFDPYFFNISELEARYMDPQQRILLEECWKSLEDAGYSGIDMDGHSCGVYIGCHSGDYQDLIDNERDVPPQSMWGNASSMIPARISYYLNLKGPAIAVDTACSSSLTAIHLACQGLWSGEIKMALAGGVFVQCTPKFYISANKANMLSLSGAIHAFDSRADGFIPSEGAGVIVLKRLSEAVADRDNIYGVIKGTGVNQDGTTNGITAPSAVSQEKLMNHVYRSFDIDPENIQYIETHGTGTILGDPIEFAALTRAFGKFTDKANYCALGSIKTNIGHTSAAAGIAGTIKILLSLKNKKIPASLNYKQSNPSIDFLNSPFYVNTVLKDWPMAKGSKRCAAVSSFGFSGTNAHLVIEEAPVLEYTSVEMPAYLIVLSARTKAQLKQHVQQMLDYATSADCNLGDFAYTLLFGRKHFRHRFACVTHSIEELTLIFQGWLLNGAHPSVVSGETERNTETEDGHLKKQGNESLKQCQKNISEQQYSEHLLIIANLFVRGYQLNLNQLYENGGFSRLSLPVYPFAHEYYWIPEAKKVKLPEETGQGMALFKKMHHPLLHRDLVTENGVEFQTRLTGNESFLSDHKVNGLSILPGAAYLELIRASIAQRDGLKNQVIHISNINWLRPLVVESEILLHTGLFVDDNDDLTYEVFTKSEGNKHIYSIGKVSKEQPAIVDKYDIPQIINTCRQNVFSASECYRFFERRGLQYGPSHRCIETLYKGSDRVLAKLVLPEGEFPIHDRYMLNPGLVDAALQSAMALDNDLLDSLKSSGQLMPFALDGFTVFNPTSTTMWAVIRHSSDVVDGGNVIKLDIDICDVNGEVAVRLKGFSVRRQEQDRSIRDNDKISTIDKNSHSEQPFFVNYNLLTPVWKTISVQECKGRNSEGESVIIFCNGQTETNIFTRYYAKAKTIFIEKHFVVDQIADKLKAVGKIKHIIWLVPDFNLISLTNNQVIEEQYSGVVLLFRGIKAFLREGYGSQEISWTIITNNSQPVYPTDQVNPTHASTHGLTGTMAKEYSLWKVRLVDLEDGGNVPVHQIQQLPISGNGEAWVYRNGLWHQRQLIPCDLDSQKILYKRRGVYVVLGGAGGIGEAWSEYMIENFDASIVWIGRRKKDDEIQAKLDKLEAKGTAPIYLSADATSSDALAVAYTEIKKRFVKINGIVHSTIVLKDRGLESMNEDDFIEGLSAKVDTSVLMAQTFKEESLDFVLFFSGIMSFTKMAGQGNYAAGCVFEDAFAHQLRHEWKCPVKVMNWGYWGTTGIVAAPEYQTRMRNMGIVSIEPQEGMQALEQLMFGPLDQVAFAKTTRKLVTDNTSLEERLLIYPKVLPSVLKDRTSNSIVPASKYEDILQKIIGITAQILDVAPDDVNSTTNLMDFGMDMPTRDMLMTLVGETFETEIPVRSLLDYESLETIADFIVSQCLISNEITDSETVSALKAQKIREEILPQILELDTWLAKFVLVTLKSFGLSEHSSFSIKDFLIATNVSSNFERWLQESCEALIDRGYLKYDGILYRTENHLLVSHNDLWKEWDMKKGKWLDNSTLRPRIQLLEKTLKALPDILTDKTLATSVLFPNSSMAMVEGIYKDNLVSEYFNEVLANAIAEYIDTRTKINPDVKIRILEIGAGTGGTSYSIFKRLREKESSIDEYCYTDLSQAFLQYAEKEYGHSVPYLSYKIFDVEKSADQQGIPLDYYDIVVAANVLHATRNIHSTIRNLKQIVRANGVIALNEMCKNRLFAHLTFGLLDGWWLYEDEILRMRGCPGLDPAGWEQVLEREGFESIYLPVKESRDLDFQIILAESNGVVRRKTDVINDTRSSSRATSTVNNSESLSMPGNVEHEMTESQLKDYLKNTISECVAEVLQSSIDKFRNDESFSSYGIDSIIAVNLINLISKRCKLNLQTTVLFDYTTIDILTDFLVNTYKSDLLEKCSEPKSSYLHFQQVERIDQNVPLPTFLHENGTVQMMDDYVRSAVYACLADVLSMPEHRIEDEKSFSDYGVDSLIAVSLINSINKKININLQTAVLFDYNNVNQLCNYILNTQSPVIESQSSILSNEKCSEISVSSSILQNKNQDYKYYSRYVIEGPGKIDDLKKVIAEVPDISDDEVQVAVKAFSLNFSDLLCAKGLYPNMPPYPFTPGVEASGIVTNIGRHVTSVCTGDPVIVAIGEIMGAHATFITCKSKYVLRMPDGLSFEQACAFPASALTMIDAFQKAKIKKGESILIHTATGGTGLIAVQLAKKYGAEIYATAGSDAKLDYLRKIGVRHCINYRSSDFEREINELTQGKGVHVIINTLSGDVIQKNMRCLATGGRYIELAMTALKSAKAIDLSVLNQNQTFFSVNLARLAIDEPELMDGYKEKMIELIKENTIVATIYKQFSFNQLKEAYRCLEDRSNIGKIVVTTFDEHVPSGLDKSNQIEAKDFNETPGIDPIAVIGMSGKFPQSDDLTEFWQHLADGDDLIVPVSRWSLESYSSTRDKSSYCNKGGFLNGIDLFDPLFFNISGVEATYMDPQQRLFLEEAWKALEDAGYAGYTTEGMSCGVFVGCHVGDYQNLIKEDSPAQAMWGNAGSVIPARISYYLNLKGPAVAIDTACSSALVGIHMACQSLWAGEVEMAIAGGVYIQTTPWFYHSANKANMLSPQGRCYTFDDRADGFVPGEGVGAIILKPLSKAKADGDIIYGVIKGSGVNQDGATNGLTAPSAVSQEKLECMVYDKFDIDPIDISMVEAHGTGTRLGDPIEFSALTNAFRRYTDMKQYCAIGSVKTNMGHAAAAAGVGGLIKILLSMKNKKIPASLHFENGNGSIDFENSPFYVNTKLQEWEVEPGRLRCAAISSFGFSGTNAHLVLEEVVEDRMPTPIRPGYMIVLSARTSRELHQRVVDLLTALDVSETPDMGDISYTLLTGRKHLLHRLACVVRSKEELVDIFRKWLEKKKVSQLYTSDLSDKEVREQTLLKKYGNDCIRQCVATNESDLFLELLATVAELYVQGYMLNYQSLFEGCCKVPLPTYPFARERYWSEEEPELTQYEQDNGNESVIHPFLHYDLSSRDEQCFSTMFTGNEFFLKDHQIGREKILPAVVYLEMARIALEYSTGREANGVILTGCTWLKPAKTKGELLNLTTSLSPKSDGSVYFNIGDSSSHSVQKPITHAEGYIRMENLLHEVKRDIEEIKKRCVKDFIDSQMLYTIYSSMEVDYGPSHQAIKNIYVGDEEAIAQIVLPKCISNSVHEFVLHPAIMDAALQATLCFDVRLPSIASSMPYSIEEVEIYHHCSENMWAIIKPAVGQIANSRTKRFGIEVCDETGQVCVNIKGFVVRTLDQQTDQSETLMFESYWEEERSIDTYEAFEYSLHILVFCNVNGALVEEMSREAEQALVHIITPLGDDLNEKFISCSLRLFGIVKEILTSGVKGKVRLQFVTSMDNESSLYIAMTALLRSAEMENPMLNVQVINIDTEFPCSQILPIGQSGYVNIKYVNNRQLVLKWREVGKEVNKELLPWKNNGVYIISGGMGGLGLLFANEIVKKVDKPVLILLGRSELNKHKQQQMDLLRESGSVIEYHIVDVTERLCVEQLVDHVASNYGQVNGVLHCAGIIDDSLITRKSDMTFREVLEPKISGLIHLDEATKSHPLDLFVCFSSVASVIGNTGQADYATANAFMDAYAEYRNAQRVLGEKSGRTVSISWALWEEGGMHLDNQTKKDMQRTTGMTAMPTKQGLQAFYNVWKGNQDHLLVINGDKDKVRESILGALLPHSKEVSSVFNPQVVYGKRQIEKSMEESTEFFFIKELSSLIKIPPHEIVAGVALENYGMDSLMIVQFTNHLEQLFGPLSKTLLFECQNISELNNYFRDNHRENLEKLIKKNKQTENKEEPLSVTMTEDKPILEFGCCEKSETGKELPLLDPSAKREDIAIIGLAGSYPGADNIIQYWKNLSQGKDSISEIPSNRWDHSLYFDRNKNTPGKTYAKWGGFLKGVDEFDPAFFNISPREAVVMDPQERLFLQCVFSTIEDAGYTREHLSEAYSNQIGVFAGVMYSEYQLYAMSEARHLPVLPGNSSSIANRVSYFFNFNGPSMVVDTMCSSSLSSLHLACQSIRQGESRLAIAGGVNVSVHPNKYLMLAQGNFASTNGRCVSFGSGGDGYVPSEGVGAVLLKKLSEAICDNDHIYGVIKGSAVNHGGKTNGFTVPNPKAQAKVIKTALDNACVSARDISYIEAHGTGTSLGDPIEIAGLTKAFRSFTSDKQYCAIGSVKSNIGHCESASGIAGLTKVLLQLKYGQLVPSLHSTSLNPNIDFTQSPFKVQQHLQEWKCNNRVVDGKTIIETRKAGLSSFGAGGSNAHVIVEEYVSSQQLSLSQDNLPVVILLSARDTDRLKERVQQLIMHIQERELKQEQIVNLAFTLQTGREEMEERLGFTAFSLSDITVKLKLFIERSGASDLLYAGRTTSSNNSIIVPEGFASFTDWSQKMIQEKKFEELIQMWIKGVKLNWNQLYGENKPMRISLPTYPFAKKTYWIISKEEVKSMQNSSSSNEVNHTSDMTKGVQLRKLSDVRDEKPKATTNIRQPVDLTPLLITQGHGFVKTIEIQDEHETTEDRSEITKGQIDLSEIRTYLKESLAKALFMELSELPDSGALLDFGLDSIVGIEWIRDVNQHFNLSIPATKIYDTATLDEFAQYVFIEMDKKDSSVLEESQTAFIQKNKAEEEIISTLKSTLSKSLFMADDEVDIQKNFIELGLDSVVGIEWVNEINSIYGTNITVSKLYDCSTLKKFAAYFYPIVMESRLEKTGPIEISSKIDSLEKLLQQVSDGVLDVESANRILKTLNNK